MIDATPLGVIHILITALIGMTGISASLIGCLLVPTTAFERIVLFAGGLLLVDPGTMTDLIGFTLLLVGLLLQYRRRKAQAV